MNVKAGQELVANNSTKGKGRAFDVVVKAWDVRGGRVFHKMGEAL